jgi:hypothetical protein
MKNSNAAWIIIKLIVFILGFLGALSLVRALNQPFNWAAAAFYGDWFNFGLGLSMLWLAVCLALMGFAVWQTKSATPKQPFYRKWDYSALALMCIAGTYLSYHAMIYYSARLGNRELMLFLPIVVYVLAMTAFIELIARLRDKNLLQNLYWLSFFKAYPIWRPMGFFAAVLLVGLLGLMFYHFSFHYFAIPIRLFAMFAVCALTYFTAFLASLSARYKEANEDKIRSQLLKT